MNQNHPTQLKKLPFHELKTREQSRQHRKTTSIPAALASSHYPTKHPLIVYGKKHKFTNCQIPKESYKYKPTISLHHLASTQNTDFRHHKKVQKRAKTLNPKPQPLTKFDQFNNTRP
ncbi:hypothetical protein M758_6G157800 [Ceratodon purpureus]|nr:hypothetical protein M758_6G157800 [Ceratodon purpureus]